MKMQMSERLSKVDTRLPKYWEMLWKINLGKGSEVEALRWIERNTRPSEASVALHLTGERYSPDGSWCI